jgi:hypothetical protein
MNSVRLLLLLAFTIPALAHPLRCDELGEIAVGIKRAGVIEINQPIGGAFGNVSLGEGRNGKRKEKQQPDGVHPSKVKGQK